MPFNLKIPPGSLIKLKNFKFFKSRLEGISYRTPTDWGFDKLTVKINE